MSTRTYWDAVWEQTVTISWDIEEVHASPNKVDRIDFLWSKINPSQDGVDFSFHLYTEWDPQDPYIINLFFDREVIMTKWIPMIATKMNRKIAEETTRVLIDVWINSLKDHKTVRETIHEYVTGFDILLLNPPEEKEPEVDLRPYVFLRFILSLPIIPEEVLHAMYVQEAAKESQKIILAEAEKIKSLQTEHYQKYGTLIEKSKAYLSKFFK